MKFFTALGGFLGFALVMGLGLATGRRSVMLLFEASLACMVGAMLFRWWHRLLLQGVQAAQHERRAAAAAAKKAESASARAGAPASR
jgi:cell division protein FtsL